MAVLYVNSTDYGSGVRYSLAYADSFIVGRDALIISTDSYGILGSTDFNKIRVEGSVFGLSCGIKLGDSDTDTGHSVYIAETGSVYADYSAVQLLGMQHTVTNFGEINGRNNGVYFYSFGANSVLTNSGTISGNVGVTSEGSGGITIKNGGLIASTNDDTAISLFMGDNILRNSGTIEGDVTLGSGNDSYDGRGGTVEGEIQGRGGNDTFRLGFGEEVIDGGAGSDTLDFRNNQRDGGGAGRQSRKHPRRRRR